MKSAKICFLLKTSNVFVPEILKKRGSERERERERIKLRITTNKFML